MRSPRALLHRLARHLPIPEPRLLIHCNHCNDVSDVPADCSAYRCWSCNRISDGPAEARVEFEAAP